MPSFSSPEMMWALIAVQVLGIACTWAARACEGSAAQTIFQSLYFVFLALVGTTTVFSMGISTGLWIASGATLGTMIVGATVTAGRATQPALG